MSSKSTRRYRKGTYRKSKSKRCKRCKRKITKKKISKMRATVTRIPNKNETLVVFKNVPNSIIKKVIKKLKNKQLGGASGPLGFMSTGISMVYGFGGGMFASLVIGASVATILSAINSEKITIDEEDDLLHKKSDARKTCKFKDEITGRCLAPMVGTTQQRRMERSAAEVERKERAQERLESAKNSKLSILGVTPVDQGNQK